MRKKLLSMLVLLTAAAPGAWADDTDNDVTVTKTANNEWTLVMPASDVELEVTYYTQDELDQQAAEDVVTKINAIGEVAYTEECKTRIDAARAAYDALTADQKALITAEQLAVLTAAEAAYEALKPIEFTWDATTNTGTLTMPASDVELVIEYKADLTLTVSIAGWTYGATASTPTVDGNEGNGAVTYEYKVKDAADDTYTTDVPNAAGEYTVRATVAETDDYADATATANFTIAKAAPSATDFVFTAPANLAFDGTAKEATVTLAEGKTGAGDITVHYQKDGTSLSAAPVETGTYTVTIDVAEGGDNFNAATALTDDSWTFTIGPAAEDADISITLTEEYGTYCLDQDLDFTETTGMTAYIAAGYNTDKGSLLMVKVTSVPAGTGLLLKSDSETGGTFTAKVKHSPYVYSNLLTGTTVETEVTTSDLILGNDEEKGIGFYRVKEAGKLAAHKAYLKDLAPATQGARMLKLEFCDDATGIADVGITDSTDASAAWYTIDGRKLQGKPTAKGLYIVNGKKVIVR